MPSFKLIQILHQTRKKIMHNSSVKMKKNRLKVIFKA